MLDNYTYDQAKAHILRLTDRYLTHLLEALDLRQIEPAGYRARLDFYEALTHGFMTDTFYKNILRGKKSSMPTEAQDFYPELKNYFWQKLLNKNFSLIFAKDNDTNNRILNQFCKVYTAFGFKDLEILVEKLKAAATLKILLKGSKPTKKNRRTRNPLDAAATTPSPVEALTAFNAQLAHYHAAFHTQRNKAWDAFYNAVSFILFPLGIGRSVYSKVRRGTWNFAWSEGKVFETQTKMIIDHCVDNNKRVLR